MYTADYTHFNDASFVKAYLLKIQIIFDVHSIEKGNEYTNERSFINNILTKIVDFSFRGYIVSVCIVAAESKKQKKNNATTAIAVFKAPSSCQIRFNHFIFPFIVLFSHLFTTLFNVHTLTSVFSIK